MVRVLLTLWFTFTTLLGPGLCCCLFRAAPASAGAVAAPTPAPPSCPCCCPERPPEPEPASPGDGPRPSCPCKEHAAQPAILPAGVEALADGAAVRGVPSVLPGALA